MLQRSLTRSLHHVPPVNACATCICSCGRRFTPDVVPHTQRRHKAKLRGAHPDVYHQKKMDMRKRAISPQERKERQLQEEKNHTWHLTQIERATRLKLISADSETIIDFLNAFAELCKGTKHKRLGASPVEMEKLQSLIAELDISEQDCNWMAHGLLLSPKGDDNTYGKNLLYALSHAGSEIATLRIMKQALQEAKQKPAKLRSSEIQHMRKHLKEIAERGENYRGMVLEGKVEYALGNHISAIKLWTDAMDAAVANARELADAKARGERPPDPEATPGADHQDLDAPWIELMGIHFARQEWAKLKWAINIGSEMDDPTAHYYAATFEKQTDASGEFSATSAWLYHMTKAAASGHPKAAHELGFFYAHSLWPYIDDEPPDHVKPTPFDRYPPESPNEGGKKSSFADMVRELLGLQPKKKEEPAENMFKTSTFPSDPKGRMRIAFEWLKIAIGRTYAPSNLLAAKLHLEKTLWASAAAPKAALDLKDERYTYASKADYLADKPISPKEADAEGEAEGGESEEIPNPFYDPAQAKWHIRQIFHARNAQFARTKVLSAVHQLRKLGERIDQQDLEEDFFTEDGFNDAGIKTSREARLFWRFPEVREMYSDDARGTIFDDTGTGRGDLVEGAKEVCEEQGWDVYDEQGGLMYKHGMGRGRVVVAGAVGSR